MYPKGCLEQFGTFVMNHAAVLGGVGVGIAFIQVKSFSVHGVLKKHCIILFS
jgi:hypothetical protein